MQNRIKEVEKRCIKINRMNDELVLEYMGTN